MSSDQSAELLGKLSPLRCVMSVERVKGREERRREGDPVNERSTAAAAATTTTTTTGLDVDGLTWSALAKLRQLPAARRVSAQLCSKTVFVRVLFGTQSQRWPSLDRRS